MAKNSKTNVGLGKGLGALLNKDKNITTLEQKSLNREDNASNKENVIKLVDINAIFPNENQPRKNFDNLHLEELATSIKNNGIIQPIIVSQTKDNFYKIIAGERRWRASRLAKLKTIPVIVRELSESEILEQALIENIQRQDLNPIEEAQAFESLMKEYNLTQESLSLKIGKSRSLIANTLRLLSLPTALQTLVIQDDISAGHARALITLNNEDLQLKLATEIVNEELSVRETEKRVKKYLTPEPEKVEINPNILLSIKDVESNLSKILGTKVQLKDKNNKGKIIINYYSADERERLFEALQN